MEVLGASEKRLIARLGQQHRGAGDAQTAEEGHGTPQPQPGRGTA
jgi:hypothetical protein